MMDRLKIIETCQSAIMSGNDVAANGFYTSVLANIQEGKWIYKEYDQDSCHARCSVCGQFSKGIAIYNGFGYDYGFSKFCEHCGAHMKEEEIYKPRKAQDYVIQWLSELMLNIEDEPIKPSEIIKRIEDGGLRRFMDDQRGGDGDG